MLLVLVDACFCCCCCWSPVSVMAGMVHRSARLSINVSIAHRAHQEIMMCAMHLFWWTKPRRIINGCFDEPAAATAKVALTVRAQREKLQRQWCWSAARLSLSFLSEICVVWSKNSKIEYGVHGNRGGIDNDRWKAVLGNDCVPSWAAKAVRIIGFSYRPGTL